MDALAKVIRTQDGRSYELKLLNNQIVTRHVSKLVSIKANYNSAKCQNIDPFQLPGVKDIILPSEITSRFEVNLPRFEVDIDDEKAEIDDKKVDIDDKKVDIDDEKVEDNDDNVSSINAGQQILPLSYSRNAEISDTTVPVVPVISEVNDELQRAEERERAEQLESELNALESDPAGV